MTNRHCILLLFPWALPTPGLWNKAGIFWQYYQCRWNKAGMAGIFKCCHPGLFVYRYSVRRSPYRTISWFRTWSQLRYLCVHFFVTFWLARYSIFSRDVSLGNTLFVLVTFRYWRFSPSMMLVVYMIRRMSSGN